jgi:hypothetical protein
MTRSASLEKVLMFYVQPETQKRSIIFTYRHSDFRSFHPNNLQLVPFALAPRAQVHAEFYRRYQALREFPKQIEQSMVRQLNSRDHEVVFIGY